MKKRKEKQEKLNTKSTRKTIKKEKSIRGKEDQPNVVLKPKEYLNWKKIPEPRDSREELLIIQNINFCFKK